MSRAYSSHELELIAARIGPCLAGRDGREMLECIERAAQDLKTGDGCPPTQVRNELRELASAARKANLAFETLDLSSDLHLAWVALERGFEVRADYLASLADVADAAADMPVVKRGKQPSASDGFIRALARTVEHFAGWRGVYSYNDIEEVYSGAFFNVVKACSEPLGIKRSDSALAKAIHRALHRDKLPA